MILSLRWRARTALTSMIAAGCCAVASTSCARTTLLHGVCGAPPFSFVCVGDLTVPIGSEPKFTAGAQGAIAAIMSSALETRLDAFIATHASDPKIKAAWDGWDAHRIVLGEREKLSAAVGITVWDGPRALAFRIFKHNIALEPPDGGPIQENRFALSGRSASDLANTYAHEVAHAVGMTHPDADTKLDRAFCEPPYVVGSLVQQIVEGAAWTWSGAGDCACLKPGAVAGSCVP